VAKYSLTILVNHHFKQRELLQSTFVRTYKQHNQIWITKHKVYTETDTDTQPTPCQRNQVSVKQYPD